MLITAEYADVPFVSEAAIEPTLTSTREKVLAAFRATHKVSTADGVQQISSLPSDKSGVKRFIEWLDAQAKKFQEEY